MAPLPVLKLVLSPQKPKTSMQKATRWPGFALGVTSVAFGAEPDQRSCRRLVPRLLCRASRR